MSDIMFATLNSPNINHAPLSPQQETKLFILNIIYLSRRQYGIHCSPKYYFNKYIKILAYIVIQTLLQVTCILTNTIILDDPYEWLHLFFENPNKFKKILKKYFSKISVTFHEDVTYYLGINMKIHRQNEVHLSL